MNIFTIEKQDGIAVISMNDPSQPQNVLNQEIQDEFEQAFAEVSSDKSLKGLIFKSHKPGCFVAGADISLLQTITSKEESLASTKVLHEFFQKIIDLDLVTVAAIDGTCLGGGLELSLAFDYRVASDDKSTKIGVPEVQLGVLPGGGGTQRIPRLIDLPTSLDLLLSGKQLDAKRAQKVGLIDEVCHRADLLKAAQGLIEKGKSKRSQPFKNRLMRLGPIRSYVISQARKKVMKMTKGKYPAPLKILDVVDKGLGKNLSKGLEIEAEGFADLIMTSVSKQLMGIFFASTDLKKDTGIDSSEPPLNVSKVGILGGGLMGAGIAYVTADRAKKDVRIKEISSEGLAKAIEYASSIVDKKLARKRLLQHQYLESVTRITGGLTYDGFANIDVVIEAVFESVDLKQRMVADIEEQVGDRQTVFATNTSAIPIDEIAAKAKFPERVVGMHYFSPVEKMPLLEVVRGSKTADWATATAVKLGKEQGKTVIVVNDGPGFYTTRILVPYCMEAVRLVLEGVAIEEVDEALESFGMPVGPLKLMDEVGIDVGAHIVETLNNAFGDRIPLIDGVERVLADDRKGKKNKRGFYDYSDASKGKKVDESIYNTMGVSYPGRAEISHQDGIAERVVLTMVNEAAYCLEEGILRSARDGDIGAIFGLGFPPFLGGPFKYVDSLGAHVVVDKLQALEKEYGKRFTPAPSLVKLAQDSKSFY
ncbi:MAG: fatty acid oxidation complex subunit alpha FadJ [Gammaproteobacteria bacterium]|nr:fatty acid oxidation complex subunit alpha FadJ [Gammaproteobacteria bacterium]